MLRADLHRATCYYRDSLGWAIIPIGKNKKPTVGWGMYKMFQPRPEEHKDWFRQNGVTGIAVLNGPISGGLVCRDFDQEDAYREWADANPTHSKAHVTVRTRRGFHVYFHSPEIQRTYKLDDGELRGSGINILPPSTHPSGILYQWLLAPDQVDKIRTIEKDELRKWGWMQLKRQDHNDLRRTEKTENTDETEITEKTEEISVISIDPELDAIIRRCLPKTEGERHRQVFDLARELKTLRRFRDSNARCFEAIIRRWHELALPVIGTKPWDETWFSFLRGWPLVRYFKDELSVEAVAEKARGIEVAQATKYGDPKLRHLAAICHELQALQGKLPFFLSCRTAAKLIDVTHHEAHRWLRGLVLDGLLEEVEKGIAGGTRATRFRFLGKLDARNGKAEG